MRILLAAVLLFAAPAMGRAKGFRDKDVGTGAAQFLKLGADARAAGLGNAGRALFEDANSAYWNPAGLAGLTYRHATMSHGAYYQNVFYDYLAYAQPIRPAVTGRRERELRADQYGAFSIALMYVNAGQIQELDNTGLETGESYTPQDAAVIAGWGLPVTRSLDVGISGKYITSRIKESAATGAFDFGARLRLRVFDTIPWIISGGIHNVGGRMKYIEQEDQVPLTFAIGNALRVTRNWSFVCDVVAARDNSLYPAFGTEYRFVYDADLSATFRFGYQRRVTDASLDGLTGISAGGGFGVGRFGVDYAWAPFGLLGDTHRIGLNYRF